jgi:hypothetical protein
MPARPAPLRLADAPSPADAAHARAMELTREGTISVEDAIEFCSLSQSELYRRMDAGELLYTHVGRRRLIFRLSVREMLARNAVVGE